MPWVPVSALPNVDVQDTIECGFFALVRHDDARVITLRQQHPSFRAFADQFVDTFRQKIDVAIMLRLDEEGEPENFRGAQAAASIRDLLAASLVPRQRSLDILHERSHRIGFSDYFWFYPWMTDKNYEWLVAATPGMLAIHDAHQFRGQHSPDLSRLSLRRSDFDQPLLAVLTERWRQHYSTDQPAWESTALFRSLNMAYHAMQFPGGAVVTYHDAGRIIGLWVAAFEILVHRGNGRVGWVDVMNHLEGVKWEKRECSEQVYNVGTVEQPRNRNLACWIYKHLNDARNNFFHGNPVGLEDIKLPESGRFLTDIAATLYRAALAKHVELNWKGESPSETDTEAFPKYWHDYGRFMEPQREAECALWLSRKSNEQVRAEWEQRVAEARNRQHEIRAAIRKASISQ